MKAVQPNEWTPKIFLNPTLNPKIAHLLNFIEIHYQLYKKLSLSISHNPLPGKFKVL